VHQAIQTKFLGPNAYHGPRVKATASDGSITLAWNDAVGIEKNHVSAAIALAANLGWKGELHGGWLDNSYVFVVTDPA
jgi:hypothetical protein